MRGGGSQKGARRSSRARFAELAEVEKIALEVARAIAAKLEEAPGGGAGTEREEPGLEVLWQGERPGRLLAFVDLRAESAEQLSTREAEIAALRLMGLSAKEIAKQIDRSTHTVKHHLERIRRKAGGARCWLLRLLSRPEVLVRFATAQSNSGVRARSAHGEAPAAMGGRTTPGRRRQERERERERERETIDGSKARRRFPKSPARRVRERTSID
jgi:DNA-binding CsgD family transcriptional regulator